MQTASRTKSQLARFNGILDKLAAADMPHVANYKLMLLQTKSKSHMGNFEHIAVMIEDMIKLLGNEQADDDKQKGFCDGEIDKASDEKAGTEDTIKSVSAAISELNEQIETVDSEIS